MKFRFLIVVATFLVSCNSVSPTVISATPNPTITASIKFQTPNITREIAAKQNGLDLVVWICGVNENLAFLFGNMLGLDGEPQPMQSTLLRSDDGGMHWNEVMSPLNDSTIYRFTMLASGKGWALIGNLSDKPYKYSLYQTIGYGLTWKQISNIPLSSTEYPIVLQMIFSDELHGQIDMLYGETIRKYLETLTTNDGGESWKQANIYNPGFDVITNSTILDSYRALIKNSTDSVNLNYSGFWTLDGRYGDPDTHEITITRDIFNYAPPRNDQIQKIILPKHFDYKDGQIILP